jgi:hypothetical protein
MDVYVEVWRGLGAGETAELGRAALEKFAGFLGTAPDLFEVFDLTMAGARGPDGYRREKMVRLKPRA